jgi:hypothetical protein
MSTADIADQLIKIKAEEKRLKDTAKDTAKNAIALAKLAKRKLEKLFESMGKIEASAMFCNLPSIAKTTFEASKTKVDDYLAECEKVLEEKSVQLPFADLKASPKASSE